MMDWKGQKVYIIGGGPSVSSIDLDTLRGKNVIGCNDAYQFTELVDYVVFGDTGWYQHHHSSLLNLYLAERLITNHPALKDEEGITCYERAHVGFHHLPVLGWNNNTGALAINFALITGASHIYLIGYDMRCSASGESNWHPNPLDNPTEENYSRYRMNLSGCLKDWQAKWPGTKIINLNVDSALECFPRINSKKHFTAGDK